MISYWEDWEKFPADCSCGWSGQLGNGVEDTDSMYVTEILCPKCQEKIQKIKNSGSEDEIRAIAHAGGKRAQQYFVDQKKMNNKKIKLHNLKLSDLGSYPLGTAPKVAGYLTIQEADFTSHPTLQGIDSWNEEYRIDDYIYAGYSLPLPSVHAEESLSSLVFIYQDVSSGVWMESEGSISTFGNKRSATWFSENVNQTSQLRPNVPVAFLLKSDQ